ncbi:MAG: PEP-CTERM sorting domain-containing protein [Phycisphaerales bacterium]|nr:PEP-CTERM sorting domain-containing protein [Phycisphaerales bacterium]
MKRALILAAAAASVSTLFAVQSQAAVFYDVNFSNQVAGNTLSFQASTAGTPNTNPSAIGQQNAPPNIDTVQAAAGYTDATTSNTIGGASDMVAVLADHSTNWSPGIYFKNAAGEEVSSGKVNIKMDVLLDTYINNTNPDPYKGGWSFFSVRNLANQNIGGFVINYGNGAALSNFATVGGANSYSGSLTAAAGTVLHVDYTADFTTLKQTLSLDNGVHSITNNLPSGSAYGQIVINPGSGPSYNTLALDNVHIESTPVPEPASLALLGLGGMLMLRRRGARSEV